MRLRQVMFLCSAMMVSSGAAAQPSPLLLAGARHAEATADEEVTDEAAPDTPAPDALFPGAGRIGASLASGVPFSVIGELTVGTSDDFALGLLVGLSTTADESAIGGRARIRLIDAGVVDFALVLPVLWYPPVDKREGASWLLTSPSLLLRGRPSHDWLVYGGAGAVLTACVDDIGALFDGGAHHAEEEAENEEMVNGAWHTFNAGVSYRVTGDLGMFLDTMVMMTDFRPSQSYGDKVGPPVLAELGANYTF